MTSIESRRLIITGVVQGVGFRYHMIDKARQLHISGWVRNRHDGSVEAIITGSCETIAALLDWGRAGPPASLVERVFVEQIEEPINARGFRLVENA